MFTIQYEAINGEHKTQAFDSTNRTKLVKHLAGFNCTIVAVYEQANVITKAMRKELNEWPGTKTRYAVAFASAMNPPPLAQTIHQS